jgi:hypothetical protein
MAQVRQHSTSNVCMHVPMASTAAAAVADLRCSLASHFASYASPQLLSVACGTCKLQMNV